MAWHGGGFETARAILPGLFALSLAAGSAGATQPPGQSSAATSIEDEIEDEEDEDDLQQRLTEREDKRRPLDPVRIDLAGRPLIVGGEVELETGRLWPHRAGGAPARSDRAFLELGVEVEAFYSFGPRLSLFAQARRAGEQDLRAGDYDRVSDRYLERGEMWLYSEDILGSGIALDLGRLDFEDDRRWWWDDEFDAIRIVRETGNLEISLAFARELGPSRSDRDFIEPEHDRVRRLIAEASWDWAPNHSLQGFALHHDDRSRSEQVGQVVEQRREDDSDARLTWLGARAIGVIDMGRRGLVGYWLDVAQVRGREHLVEYEALSPSHGEVVATTRQTVRGQALDAGINWLLPLAHEPRLFAAVASGSGDAVADDGVDRAFRQTALHANEAGFGGVERYPHYGVLLAPELSNLRVLTFGMGITLLRSSSLDVVLHRYRLRQPAESLRDSQLELELDAVHRDLGSAVDVVLALEEWERFELFAVLSGLRTGQAVIAGTDAWNYGAFVAVRVAF